MTQSIGDTHELVFGSKGSNAAAFDSRRWFRLPVADEMISEGGQELAAADRILANAIKKHSRKWAAESGAASVPFELRTHAPPRMPYDVFAFAAHLMESAGIYHRMQPMKVPADSDDAPPVSPSNPLEVSHADRELAARTAAAWCNLPSASGGMQDFARHLTSEKIWNDLSPLFESWWVVTAANSGSPILSPQTTSPQPKWWKHVWRLLAIADEAAAGTGFQLDTEEMQRFLRGEQTTLRWFEFELLIEHVLRGLRGHSPMPKGRAESSGRLEFADITTLSIARPTVVNVLPKVRTPSVGCTLRSLSHHLALLPPTGIVKGRWTPSYLRPRPKHGSMPGGVMNLLLVPMPFSISAQAFEQAKVEDKAGSENGTPRIGYFDVTQKWIKDVKPAKLMAFLDALIDTAKAQAKLIHGVVFPELALDHSSFELIREHISKNLPEAEILVSGVSEDGAGRSGNFVAVATFPGSATRASSDYRQTIREKHHRWKLDQTQIRDYGLLGALSPELSWWENISLEARQVDFTVLRRESVLAAMICEDLARVDPCQQVIRAVGPNLVVALLMDAPQIEARWPARYATVLAEDPGCSVLTLTSRGLMTRQHRLGTFRSNGDDRVVAMWRDDGNSSPKRLRCPYDAQGILLTIAERPVSDVALDGRIDGRAKAWKYVGDVPLRVPDARKKYAEVLGDDDLACW